MRGYYGYGSDSYSYVGQEYDPTPPRLQAYEKHAQRKVLATAARMTATSFFLWIIDADGHEYVQPFASSDELSAALRRKNHNYYYYAAFNKTGPVWPKPDGSGYGCHSPEWTTWPSEFPTPQVTCPNTISGRAHPYYYQSVGAWPWGYVGQVPPGPPPVSPNLRAWTAALTSYLMERGTRPTPREKREYLMQAAFEHFLAAGMSDRDIVSTFARTAEYWADTLKTYGSFQRMPSTIPAELLR